MMAQASNSFADELVKTIPAQSFNIPAGDLTKALSEYSATAGVLLSFDSELTHSKTTQGLKGQYTVKEGFSTLLKDSGLEIINNKKGELELRKAPTLKVSESDSLPLNAELSAVEVRAKRFYEIGPLPGLGLTKEQIPGNVQSITAKEIKESHSLSITDLMNKKLQSVNVNDYQGNPFQMDVTYRGFTAGPQIGTPQGLSVFFDGIRVNEPFGDVVNWDMIPMNALAGVDVFPGSNPIFGLNTLGGAFTVKTKDGFNHEGFDAEVLSGSFGRKQLQVEGGWNNGTVALFGAGNFFLEDGWRENSPSKVNQFFGKASYRGDKLDLNFSSLIVGTDLVGNGLLPGEMYAQDRNGSFTSEDTTKNRLQQFQLSSSYFVNDNFTVTGQVYRRKSDRRQKGSDVMRDYSEELTAKRLPTDADQYTCLFPSTNNYNLPDYIVVPVENYDPLTNTFNNTTVYDQLFNQQTFDVNAYINDPATSSQFNKELPADFLAAFRYRYELERNFTEQESYNRNSPPPPLGQETSDFFNELSFFADFNLAFNGGAPSLNGVVPDDVTYYFTKDPISGVVTKNHVLLLGTLNEADCTATKAVGFELPTDPLLGNPIYVDGVSQGQAGYVEGTPTALITDNQIDQVTDGISVQLNWNFDKHKFMVGASIDSASAEYTNEQRLGFLDANRKGYLDPAQAHPQFAGAYVPLANNNFEGTNITKSLYFSETWSPIETLHLSASGRYNQTRAKNKIAARSGLFNYSIGDLIALPDNHNVCRDTNGNGTVETADCAGIPLNYRPLRLNDTLEPAETEKFSYYSFNPSLGASWQVKENLNIYGNIAKGTRTPSVIELGCALDKTPVGPFFSDGNGNLYQQPKSLFENRQCTLPTTLSGDPYLPQIKATTYDIGLRGTVGDNLQWNLGAYQTDLKDDIYFVAVGAGSGFFDSIGNTRRRGLEAGLSGKKDKWGFGVNYSLTDATFQNNFLMFSEDNSSAKFLSPLGLGVIEVEKDNRMPGVPLHNLNANVSYDVTDKWTVGFSAVMHSDSYVRGNENNKHRTGVIRRLIVVTDQTTGAQTIIQTPPTTNPGKVPGYTTFNFQTSYKFNKEWTASMLVNNVFDKEYFTAGRLGSNPFSPSINGAIGVSGYNHNSGDWLSTNFIAPSAPRGVWFSLNWQFDPNKK
ncbi:MAG: TonB-dependent receptor [Pseudomonadota bacterium]